jgi:hypothetical protein
MELREQCRTLANKACEIEDSAARASAGERNRAANCLSGEYPSGGTSIAHLEYAYCPGGVTVVRTFCTTGENEALKGSVHALGGILAATMAAYNIAAWCYRREAHLGVNAVVYTLAVLWELKQTVHHLERCDRLAA